MNNKLCIADYKRHSNNLPFCRSPHVPRSFSQKAYLNENNWAPNQAERGHVSSAVLCGALIVLSEPGYTAQQCGSSSYVTFGLMRCIQHVRLAASLAQAGGK